MEFDRKYVTAGMDYKCYDQPEDEIKEDKGYGGGKPKFPNDLVARKAYFMLDRECVCLGAGITSTMDSSVNTIVEHRALVKDTKEAFGTERIAVDGEEYPTDTFYEKRGKALMAEIGGVGYVFPNTESIYLSRYAFDPKDAFFDRQYLSPDYQKDLETFKNGDKPFVELRIEHGKNPQNASYVYAILPTTSGRNLARYAAKPEFTVLSNTTQCQAVRKDSIGITCIVFYEAGECAGIRVDHPAIVTYTEHDGELRIKVAEPTNKVDTLTVRIERPLTAVTHHPRFTVSCTPDAATLTLDASLSVGEGYEAAFKY